MISLDGITDDELADIVWTAICAIQHFTKDITRTAEIINSRRQYLITRAEVRSHDRTT